MEAPIYKQVERRLIDRLERPLRDLRISVMDRCNYRCTYCMPEETFNGQYRFLSSTERLTFDEIVRLCRLTATLGVNKVRITGGEPLLRPNLPDLVRELRGIPGISDLALTTNGVLLSKQAAALKAAGLGRITVSLDSLDDAVFERMNGHRLGKQSVLDGIAEAVKVGLDPVKINTVVQRGVNDDTALELLSHFRGSGIIVRFIEFMDVGVHNRWAPHDVVPSAELVRRIADRWPIRPAPGCVTGEVARRYVYEDGKGEIGFVSSVSEPFCGSCVRARISSDGVLYTCLFASNGTNLKSLMRNGASDSELLNIISSVWNQRSDRYSELRASQQNMDKKKVEMHYIGG